MLGWFNLKSLAGFLDVRVPVVEGQRTVNALSGLQQSFELNNASFRELLQETSFKDLNST